MGVPNERTQAMVRTWEYRHRLTLAADTPGTIRGEAETVLRHLPRPAVLTPPGGSAGVGAIRRHDAHRQR